MDMGQLAFLMFAMALMTFTLGAAVAKALLVIAALVIFPVELRQAMRNRQSRR